MKKIRTVRKCIYCNTETVSFDHIIPFSAISLRKRRAKRDRAQNRDFRVPACQSCNRILLNYIFSTMKERMVFLKEKLCQSPIDENLGRRLRFLSRVIDLQDDDLDGPGDDMDN